MPEIRKDGGSETVKRGRVNKFIIAAIIAVIFIIIISVLFFAMDNDNNLKNEDIKKELYGGKKFYLSNDRVAAVVPKEKIKVFLSEDKGETWKRTELDIDNSERKYESECFIGFNSDDTGYLVMTSDAAMNHQDKLIFITDDFGENWSEIKTNDDVSNGVMTGAGYSPTGTVYISYRYYEDHGPDIRYTEDKGESWNKLNINLKEPYNSENYKFNAESPVFDGLEGTYPIKAAYLEENDPVKEKTINLESKDGGKTWNW